MGLLLRSIVSAALVMVFSSAAMAENEQRFREAAQAVAERIEAADEASAYPARALVLVRAGAAPIVDVTGRTADAGGVPASADTPFYIASMTKAFVGLMAARLDQQGIMPLDTTLGEIFPELVVEGIDFNAITMKRALSHQLGFRAPPLNLRTAYTDDVPLADYPAIINAAAVRTDEPFRYDNLGYLLYAAALERKTGRSWRSWIEDTVFDPLGMEHSSARTSDFRDISALHELYREGYVTIPPKPDAVMHAAGGLVISGQDMARWLDANLRGNPAIPETAFAAAQKAHAEFEMSDGPMRCTGYTLGWRQCEAFGLRFLEHGGGYTGMRGQMVILPEEGVGFAVMFNSDSMTGWLSGQLMQTFIMTYAGRGEALPPASEVGARYAERTSQFREERTTERDAETVVGEGTWRPAGAELLVMAGRYTSPSLGELILAVEGDRLTGWMNGTPMTMRPAGVNSFRASLATDGGGHDPVRIDLVDGRVRAVWFADYELLPVPVPDAS